MNYEVKVDKELMQKLEENEKYKDLIKLLVEEMKFNYDKLDNTCEKFEELKDLYTSIAYFSPDNKLVSGIDKDILFLVKYKREIFRGIYLRMK